MNKIILAIQDGGVWMAPILLAFGVALAIASERLVAIMKAKSNKTGVMKAFSKLSCLVIQIKPSRSKTCGWQAGLQRFWLD